MTAKGRDVPCGDKYTYSANIVQTPSGDTTRKKKRQSTK